MIKSVQEFLYLFVMVVFWLNGCVPGISPTPTSVATVVSPSSTSPVYPTFIPYPSQTVTIPVTASTQPPTPTYFPLVSPYPALFYDLDVIKQNNSHLIQQLRVFGKGLIWNQQMQRNFFFDSLRQIWLLSTVKQPSNWLIVPTTRGIYVYDIQGNSHLSVELANVFDISLDEKWMVTGDNAGTLKLWEMDTAELITDLSCPLEVKRDAREIGPDILPAIGDVALSPDGTQLAALCNVNVKEDGWPVSKILVWEKQNNNSYSLRMTLEGETSPEGTGVLEFSNNGKFIFNGTRLIDVSSGLVTRQFEISSFERWNYLKPVFSPDDSRLIISMQHETSIWDLISGKQITKIGGQDGAPSKIDWDNNRIIFDDVYKMKRVVRNAKNSRLIERSALVVAPVPYSLFDSEHIWGVRGAKYHDTKITAWGLTDEFVFWWDIPFEGKSSIQKIPITSEMVGRFAFSKDGNWVAICTENEHKINLLSKTGEFITLLTESASSCDGILFMSSTKIVFWKNRKIGLINLAADKGLSRIVALDDEVKSVILSEDGQMIGVNLQSQQDGIPYFVLMDNQLTPIKRGRITEEWLLSFSQDNRLLITQKFIRGSLQFHSAKIIHIRDTNSKEMHAEISVGFIPLQAFLFPDSSLIVISDRLGNLYLFGLDGKIHNILRGHHHLISIRIDPIVHFELAKVDDWNACYVYTPSLDSLKQSIQGKISLYNFYSDLCNVYGLTDFYVLENQRGILSIGKDGTIRLWGIRR